MWAFQLPISGEYAVCVRNLLSFDQTVTIDFHIQTHKQAAHPNQLALEDEALKLKTLTGDVLDKVFIIIIMICIINRIIICCFLSTIAAQLFEWAVSCLLCQPDPLNTLLFCFSRMCEVYVHLLICLFVPRQALSLSSSLTRWCAWVYTTS